METLTTSSSSRAQIVLSQGASFWVAAGVVAHTLWTSAAPAVTYPLYATHWHLTPTVTTAIFAVYPIAVVATLFAFGNLSERIGRRAAMLLGLAASEVGVLLFAVAPSVWFIFAGRVWMRLGVGLSASAATAALVEFSPEVPGLRTAQKYAVSCGGGHIYRIGLFDQVLIKENHIAAAGSLTAAVAAARRAVGSRKIKVDVEVETMEEFEEALRGAPAGSAFPAAQRFLPPRFS